MEWVEKPLSPLVALHPGAPFLTGAPGTVEQLHQVDIVEVESPGIGTLRNPVVFEESG